MLVKHPAKTMSVANCLGWLMSNDMWPISSRGNNSCGLRRGIIWLNSLCKGNQLFLVHACPHVAVRQCSAEQGGAGKHELTHPGLPVFILLLQVGADCLQGFLWTHGQRICRKQSNTLPSRTESQTHEACRVTNRDEKHPMAERWGGERHRN